MNNFLDMLPWEKGSPKIGLNDVYKKVYDVIDSRFFLKLNMGQQSEKRLASKLIKQIFTFENLSSCFGRTHIFLMGQLCYLCSFKSVHDYKEAHIFLFFVFVHGFLARSIGLLYK